MFIDSVQAKANAMLGRAVGIFFLILFSVAICLVCLLFLGLSCYILLQSWFVPAASAAITALVMLALLAVPVLWMRFRLSESDSPNKTSDPLPPASNESMTNPALKLSWFVGLGVLYQLDASKRSTISNRLYQEISRLHATQQADIDSSRSAPKGNPASKA